MVRNTIILFLFLLLPWLAPSNGQAAISGKCYTCHVMHASQLGVPSNPNGYLLVSSCVACHTGDNAGAFTPATDTPYVYQATGAHVPLAGGDFINADIGAAGANERKGHNPEDLAGGTDVALGANPPGWKAGFTVGTDADEVGNGAADWAANSLSCAGVYGCHGRHNGSSEPMHHADVTGTSTVVDGSSLGESYRFLYGIKGGEDDDYEFETAVDHNAYYGTARAIGAIETPSDTGSISYFCAECHGIFHSGTGITGGYNDGLSDSTIGSPWIRHPVDFSMPTGATTEYAKYSTYNPAVPLATSIIGKALNFSDVTASADRIVMCLSCHYAHAGPNLYALRWDTEDMEVGAAAQDTNGCFACHTAKDSVTAQ